MSYRIFVLLTAALCFPAFAQHHPAPAAKPKPVTLMSGLGDLRHPVTTSKPQAQLFFDQGLRLIYAFNHDEAARSFQHAANLDPKLAMAYWGMAEAVGPNYNDPASEDRFRQAHEAIAKAVNLRARPRRARRPTSKPWRSVFQRILSPTCEKQRKTTAMPCAKSPGNFRTTSTPPRYFAESGMNLHPWGLWHQDGAPEEGTEEIVVHAGIGDPPRPRIIWERSTITSTPSRLPSLRNVRWPAPTGWPRSPLPPDTSYTCPPTSTSAPETTNPPSAPTKRLPRPIRPTSRPAGLQGIYSDDVLQPQPAFHRHVRRDEWQLSRG